MAAHGAEGGEKGGRRGAPDGWRRRALSLPRVTVGTLVRLLLASLAVGAAMALLGVTPRDILAYATGFTREVVENAAAWVGTAVSYVLLGAVIVIPIWLLSLLFRSFRR
jgi:type IV secretory pathway VirB6-like protein